MTQRKLTLKKQSSSDSPTRKPVFIDTEYHKQLLELKNETGVPLKRIVAKFIKYGIENVEIIEDTED